MSPGHRFDINNSAGTTDMIKPGKKDSAPRISARAHQATRKNFPATQYLKKSIPMENAPRVNSHTKPVPSVAVQKETLGLLKSSDAIRAYL
jgi:hypothetical protein